MAISYIDSGTEFADNTSGITLSKPAAAQAGDLLIVRVSHQALSAAITTPAAFTGVTGTTNIGNVDYRVTVCHRVVQSADSSWEWTSGTVKKWALSWILLRGVDETTPIDASGTNHIGNGTSCTPGCTTTVADTLLVVLAGSDVNESRTWTATTGTKRVEATLGADFLTHLIATKAGGSAGAKTFNVQQSGNNQSIDSTLIAVKPAAGGPVQGSGSVSVTTSVSGAGVKKSAGAGSVSVSTSVSGAGVKKSAGAGSVSVSTSVSGTGAATAAGVGSINVGVSVDAPPGLTIRIARFGGLGSPDIEMDISTGVAGAGAPVSGPVQGSGAISVAVDVSGAGVKAAAGAGSVAVATDVSGAGQEKAAGVGSISVAVDVSGAGVKAAAGAGSVAVATDVAGAGFGPAQGSGSISVAVDVSGAGVKAASSTGSISVAVAVDAVAGSDRSGAGSISVAVGVSGAGSRADALILVDTHAAGRGYVIGEPYLNGIRTTRLVVQMALGTSANNSLWGEGLWGTARWTGFDAEWIDITDDVVRLSTKTGRAANNESFPAGSMRLRLINTQGQWSLPDVGPGLVDVQVGLRVRASIETATGGTIPIWTGFISTMNEVYTRLGESYVEVECVDATAWIGRATLEGTFWGSLGEPEYALRHVLDAAGWPRGNEWRNASPPCFHTLIPGYDPGGESAVDVARRIADAEGGAFYIDAQGRATLQNREWLSGTDGDPPAFTIDTLELADLDLRDVAPRRRSTSRVINEARYRRIFDTEESDVVIKQDSASKALYGRRVAERLDLLCKEVFQVDTLASRLILYRAYPTQELQRVKLRPQTDAKAALVIEAIIGDVFQVDYEHPREGWVWTHRANLVGVEHDIAKEGAWTVTLHGDVTYQTGGPQED